MKFIWTLATLFLSMQVSFADELIHFRISNHSEDDIMYSAIILDCQTGQEPGSYELPRLDKGVTLGYPLHLNDYHCLLAKPFNIRVQLYYKDGPFYLCPKIIKNLNAAGILNPMVDINVSHIDEEERKCNIDINVREDHE